MEYNAIVSNGFSLFICMSFFWYLIILSSNNKHFVCFFPALTPFVLVACAGVDTMLYVSYDNDPPIPVDSAC